MRTEENHLTNLIQNLVILTAVCGLTLKLFYSKSLDQVLWFFWCAMSILIVVDEIMKERRKVNWTGKKQKS